MKRRHYALEELFGRPIPPPSNEPFDQPKIISITKPDGSFRFSLAHSQAELIFAHFRLLEDFKDGDRVEIKDLPQSERG